MEYKLESSTHLGVQRLLSKLDYREERYSKHSQRISFYRALVFGVFLIVVWFSATNKLSFSSIQSGLANTILIVLIIGFLFLVALHRRLEKSILDLSIQKYHVKTDACRINHSWNEIPRKPENYSQKNNTADDLKIIGDRSLIHLIDTTSSIEARNLLIQYLVNPSLNIEEIQWRQKCVQALKNKRVLFAKLRLAGGKVGAEAFSGHAILQLLESCKYPKWGKPLLLLCVGIAIFNAAVLLVFGINYFLISFTSYVVLLFLFERHSSVTYSRIVGINNELSRIQSLLKVLEKRANTDDKILFDHFAPLHGASSPSQLTNQLSKRANALSVRAFAPLHIFLNAVLPWDQYHVYKLESIRKELLENLHTWLDLIAKTEAYFALAHFAQLHPHYCQPQLMASSSKEHKGFTAKELGHPLIPHQERIVNDFSIDDGNRVAIVTGSNMAGKTAFLRTVGINMCLAQAGAVVCASQFTSSLFQVVSCIDVTDDLESGKSLFYREIEKLKAILASVNDESHDTLFLIDEILKSTNNQERIIGGKKYLQSVSNKGGFGLVSTHDLEFSNLADEDSRMFNIHFTDTIINEEMIFDRKLKTGRSNTTNALRIMEIEGVI